MKIINNLNKYVRWLRDKNISPRTIELYTQAIKKFAETITTDTIRKFFKSKINKYEINTLKIFRQAFSSYSQFEGIKIDWTRIKGIIPKLQRKFFVTVNLNEFNLLKATRTERFLTNYQRNNLILDFLLYTGLRVSELVSIRHSDFQTNNYTNSLKVLGKGNKVRYICIPEFLTKYFNTKKKSYLFGSVKGKKLLTKKVQRIIRIRVEKSGIKKNITPHTFRRSFATLLNKKQVRLTTIQQLLGHTDINTTVAYIHNSYEELYDDYSKLWKDNDNFSQPSKKNE